MLSRTCRRNYNTTAGPCIVTTNTCSSSVRTQFIQPIKVHTERTLKNIPTCLLNQLIRVNVFHHNTLHTIATDPCWEWSPNGAPMGNHNGSYTTTTNRTIMNFLDPSITLLKRFQKKLEQSCQLGCRHLSDDLSRTSTRWSNCRMFSVVPHARETVASHSFVLSYMTKTFFEALQLYCRHKPHTINYTAPFHAPPKGSRPKGNVRQSNSSFTIFGAMTLLTQSALIRWTPFEMIRFAFR